MFVMPRRKKDWDPIWVSSLLTILFDSILFIKCHYLTEALETTCRRWLFTALEQVTSIIQGWTALCTVCWAAPVHSFHCPGIGEGRGGDMSTAGRVRTGGDIYFPRPSRAGQIRSSSSMSSVFGTSHRWKAKWQLCYSKRSRPFPTLLTQVRAFSPVVATGFCDVNGLHQCLRKW